jgi:hypothetical protein
MALDHASESTCENCCFQLSHTDHINKCKVLCINCGHSVIAWRATELVKRNGSDVYGEMKYCPRCWTTPARRSVLAPPVVTTKSIYKLTSQFYPSCHSHKIPTTKIILHNTITNQENIQTTCDPINGCYALLNIAHPHAFEVADFEILIARNLCMALMILSVSDSNIRRMKKSVFAMLEPEKGLWKPSLARQSAYYSWYYSHVSACVRASVPRTVFKSWCPERGNLFKNLLNEVHLIYDYHNDIYIIPSTATGKHCATL